MTDLRTARQQLGLTQAELAALMEVPPNNVSRIERGHQPPPVRYVRLLRAYLDGHRPEDWPDGARQRKLAKQARERKRQ